MPRRAPVLALAAVLAGMSTPVTAANWWPLRGAYAVTGAHALNPPPGEPDDTHYRIQLRGASAAALYDHMKVSPVRDPCTGGRLKRIGQMRCVLFPKDHSYECDFSIDIARQRIDRGLSC